MPNYTLFSIVASFDHTHTHTHTHTNASRISGHRSMDVGRTTTPASAQLSMARQSATIIDRIMDRKLSQANKNTKKI